MLEFAHNRYGRVKENTLFLKIFSTHSVNLNEEDPERPRYPGVEDLFRRATFLFRAPVSNPRGCRRLMHAVPEFKKRNILKHVFLKISTLHAEGHGWPVRHVPFQKCSIFLQPDAGLSPAANMQTQPRPGTGKCILFFCAPIKRGESGGPCLL